MLNSLWSLVSHRRWKWVIVVFWLVVLAGTFTYAQKLTDAQTNDASAWLPKGAESTRAAQQLEQFQSKNSLPTVVVYESSRSLTAADVAQIREQAGKMSHLDAVSGPVVGPLVAPDRRAAQTIVTFDVGSKGWAAMRDKVDQLRSLARISGVDVHVTGPGGQAADSSEAFQGIDSTLLYAAGGVVIFLLLLTYRSPVLWILPVVSAVVALTAETTGSIHRTGLR